MKRISLLVIAVAWIGLAGCAELPQFASLVAQGMQAENASKNVTATDADMIELMLATPTTPDLFVENAKAVVGRLGYQVNSVNGSGPIRVVTAVKQKMPTGLFVWSRQDMTYIVVMMQLNQDGRTITVSSQNRSNTGEGAPGAAKKVANEFRDALGKLYAASQ